MSYYDKYMKYKKKYDMAKRLSQQQQLQRGGGVTEIEKIEEQTYIESSTGKLLYGLSIKLKVDTFTDTGCRLNDLLSSFFVYLKNNHITNDNNKLYYGTNRIIIYNKNKIRVIFNKPIDSINTATFTFVDMVTNTENIFTLFKPIDSEYKLYDEKTQQQQHTNYELCNKNTNTIHLVFSSNIKLYNKLADYLNNYLRKSYDDKVKTLAEIKLHNDKINDKIFAKIKLENEQTALRRQEEELRKTPEQKETDVKKKRDQATKDHIHASYDIWLANHNKQFK